MKKHIQIGLLLLVILSITSMFLYFDSKAMEKDRQSLESSLMQEILQNQMGEIPVVNFSLLTTFSWDRLYVFRPYTQPKRIDSILRSFWIGSRFTEIESSDRITLLVFTRNGQVVQYLEFPRSSGDFSRVDNGIGYAGIEAKFIVNERGQMIWFSGKK